MEIPEAGLLRADHPPEEGRRAILHFSTGLPDAPPTRRPSHSVSTWRPHTESTPGRDEIPASLGMPSSEWVERSISKNDLEGVLGTLTPVGRTHAITAGLSGDVR